MGTALLWNPSMLNAERGVLMIEMSGKEDSSGATAQVGSLGGEELEWATWGLPRGRKA